MSERDEPLPPNWRRTATWARHRTDGANAIHVEATGLWCVNFNNGRSLKNAAGLPARFSTATEAMAAADLDLPLA